MAVGAGQQIGGIDVVACFSMKRAILLIVPAVLAFGGCKKEAAKQAEPDPAGGQTAQQAAEILCAGATKVVADAKTANVVSWSELVGDGVQHKGVRDAMKALAADGGRDPIEPFFANMADQLGHEWDCPDARKLLGG